MAGPPISFDMDGVLCTPFLGYNIAIRRSLSLPPLPSAENIFELAPEHDVRYLRVRRRIEFVRYLGRRPLPGVREGLQALSGLRELVLVTGRSWIGRHLIERWLQRHELAGYFREIRPNNTNLSTAHFKLLTAQRLHSREHIDDDGSIAYFLANHGIRVYLREWPRNRDLPYPESVRVFHHLSEVAEDLAARGEQAHTGRGDG